MRKLLRKIKYLLLRLLRIKDKSHAIARGFTIGAIINFVPTFGFGPFLSSLAPKIVRGNLIAGFIGGLAFLWAFPIMFYVNVVVGEALLPIEIAETIEDVIDSDTRETEEVLEVGLQLGQAFFLGMAVNMILFGVLIYLLIYTTINRYRHELLRFIYKNWKL